ncbi:MAG: toll/interleukin-1 receptor domain-containing protein, partial [Pseudomonadota bacterium]|nr:toll/interleukin-1 receptor domain-containing protein [Pseudomonadota bacterium]
MQVFISFSSADRKIAEKIYDRLKKGGIDCWICTQDIPPGADYQACIVEAITASEVVVLVFSSKANLSPEIAKELSLASKKILIPARIEDVVPQGSFQYQLSNRQFVDLFDDFDNKLDELVERIQSVLAGAGG